MHSKRILQVVRSDEVGRTKTQVFGQPVAILLAMGWVVGCRDAPPPSVAPGEAHTSASSVTSATTSYAVVPSAAPTAKKLGPWHYSFDTDTAGGPPKGMSFATTGTGKTGRWLVQPDVPSRDAPSAPHVLVQVDPDNTGNRFPVAVADAPNLMDVSIQVKCKAMSGKVDQACGAVARYQNADNYVITRANALEGNVRLYVVKDGVRKQLASWSGTVLTGAWQQLRLDARGDRFEVWWNSAKVIDHHDGTFASPGKIGVWTKADSVTAFDDLTVEAL